VAIEAPAATDWALDVRDIVAGYGAHTALDGVTFTIEPGCLAGLVGPNGSGKSTLMKVALGLMKPWSGDVSVFGGSEVRGIVGYTPQVELVDWAFPVTVGDVVMMGRYPALGPLRRPGPADRAAVTKALEQVGMAEHRSVQIGQLSGGQRRRVFLARALAADPDLYLLDEPEAPLSPQSQLALITMMMDMVRQDAQFIIATHSPILLGFPDAAIYTCDRAPAERVAFDDLDHVVITRDFLNNRERYLRHLAG